MLVTQISTIVKIFKTVFKLLGVEKVHNLIVGVKEGEVDFEISIWTKSSDDSRCLNKCNIFRTSINWSLSSKILLCTCCIYRQQDTCCFARAKM